MNAFAFRTLGAMIRAHWFSVLFCALLGALSAAALNISLPVMYEASARMFVATPNYNDSTASGEPDLKGKVYTYAFGDEYTQQRIMSYQQMIGTPIVTNAVIKELGLQMTPDELADRLTARVVPDTVMMDIRAQDPSPEQAVRIANAASEQLSLMVQELEKPFRRTISPILPITLEPAEVPTSPESPKPLLNLLVGTVLGLAVGITYATLREARAAAEIPEEITVSETTLSVLHGVEDAAAFVKVDDLDHELTEDLRYLCLRITSALKDAAPDVGVPSILCASPRATDVVGAAAVLVASSLAELGHRVAIVLTNFGAAAEPGLGDVLDGRKSLPEVLRYDGTSQVSVLMAGATNASAAVAYSATKTGAVVEQLKSQADYVIVIASPVLESSDSVQLAGFLDAALLICPVPPVTAAEIAESERLIGLTPAAYLGRVVVRSEASSGKRTNRTFGGAERRKVSAET